MQGWIKLHRQLIKWEWYKDSKMVHLFIHLLLLANHEPHKWQGIEVQRGQVVTGLNSLNESTGISIQSLRTCLSKLIKSGELTSESTNKYRILTLCNYGTYQSEKLDSNTQTNNQLTIDQQSINNQLTANKNDKNENNDNNVKVIPDQSGILDIFNKTSNDRFTEVQFKDAAVLAGCTDEEASEAFHHYRAQGFVRANGQPLMNIASGLVNWKRNRHRFAKAGSEDEQERKRQEKLQRVMANVERNS